MPKFTVLKSTKSSKEESYTLTLGTKEKFGPLTMNTKYYIRGMDEPGTIGEVIDVPTEAFTTVEEKFVKDGKTFTCRWIVTKYVA